MIHLGQSPRSPTVLSKRGLVVLFLALAWAWPLCAQETAKAKVQQRASLLSDDQKVELLKSDLSADQTRSLLLEQGFSPREVEEILRLHPENQLLLTGERQRRTQEWDEAAPGLGGVGETGEPEEGEEPSEDVEVETEGVVPAPPEPRPFGYRLFSQGPSSFAPPTRAPVGSDYLLGPDDTVVINAWGPTELSYSRVINPEGHIVIPEMGIVYLSGRTLGDARAELTHLFEKFYPGIKIHVTVGQLRTLQVYVVGEVTQPGAYTVSSLSTVFTALYWAGGPTEFGSLRQIRLLRENEVIGVVDLYRYLLEGDRTHDLRLENDDTIFVPPVGSRVALLGEVRRPAIYEILPGEGLADVIRMTGGVLPTGYLGRVQIDRILNNEKHVVLDVDYLSAEGQLSDGDEVRVFPVVGGYENAVWIAGAVKRPGRYQLKEDMTLLDLVGAAEGLMGEAYLPRLEVERTEPNEQIRFLSPDLGAILRGEEPDVALMPKDFVRVFSIWEVKDREEVEIFGEVRRPGRYPLAANMTLGDLIFRAGGLKESAYLMRAEISRIRRATEGDPLKSDVIPVRLTDVVSGNDDENPKHLLQAGDKVFIRRIPQWDSLHTVTIEGEVRFPGTYALMSSNETLADLFQRAGGTAEEAFLEAAVLDRRDEGRVVVDFPKAVVDRSKRENLSLVDGDRVRVPKIPETVQVMGAVFRPSSLKFVPGKTADYYVRKCGGYLERADRTRVRITRTSGEVVASRRLWFDPDVRRGNVIVVPFKEEKKEIDWEKIAQVTNVLAGLATTVYLLTEAYKQ